MAGTIESVFHRCDHRVCIFHVLMKTANNLLIRGIKMKAMKLGTLPLLFLFPLLSPSIAGDTITPSTSLRDEQTLVSSGGDFVLGFFSPPNSKNRFLGIWYNKISVQTPIWVANRDKPLLDSTGVLNLSSDGELTLYNQVETVLWSTNSSNSNLTSPVARLLDTGNLVLVEENNESESYIWQSFDQPSDTLLPGMKLGWNLKKGLDHYLTTWKSTDDPSPGDYTFKMDIHGSPQFFIWHGEIKVYRSGPWNGIRFSGEPEMESNNIFSFDFTSNQDEVYYSFEIKNSCIISRFMLNQSMIQRYVWFDSQGEWSLYWSIPRDQCDYYAECGPFGVCNSNDSPVCNCVKGFDPKSPQEWELRDASSGCVRRTPLDCPNGDGFLQMNDMKLPDTSNATVDESMSLEECGVRCLLDCSCTAYASATITAGGSGCIIWTDHLVDLREYVDNGQDLYIRLAASELGSSKKKRVIIIVIVVIISGMLLLVSFGYCIWKKRSKNYGRRKNQQRQLSFELSVATLDPINKHFSDDESTKGKVLDLPVFDLSTISIATDNFSTANKLGEGGFGSVYKGDLGDGQGIAVKRLSKTSLQGLDEFKNEVILIAKLQHINLVRLLGCCIHGEERMLIYEYMHNRSLDLIIFDQTKSVDLIWPKRYSIISGIARGLVYLHQDSRFRIIHRDLKASNILLDKDMNPKISDFGVARIFGGDQNGDYTKRVVGTYGYMSPEYAMDGIFSVKSDVFSFGVLVLEIISGKRNRVIYSAESELNLLNYAWKHWKEDSIMELVDKSMACTYNISEVLRCIHIGLLCVQERAEDRPQMSTVIMMLGSPSAMLPKPKQPGFSAGRCLIDPECSSSHTLNEITITLFEGR